MEIHVAAVGSDGALLHFTGMANTPWQVEDLTDQLGISVQDGIAGWGTWNMPLPGTDNIAGVSPDGDLLHFWRSGQSWLYENVSSAAGGKTVAPVSHCAKRVDATLSQRWYDYLIVNSTSGDVLVYTGQLLQHAWTASNISISPTSRAIGPFGAWTEYLSNSPAIIHAVGLQPD
jgi:hypothetical protein